jgi:hypothetical protein
MKTAMQELIEYLENTYYVKEILDWEDIKKNILEKEKEQIIDAWDKIGSTIVPRYFLEENITGEEYYNQTYNQDRITINETKKHIEEIGKLMYYKNTTTGLWATDRLDLVPDEIKHLFFKLK